MRDKGAKSGQRREHRKQEENLATSSNSDDVPNLDVLRRWIKPEGLDGNLCWATKDAISHVPLALRILARSGRVHLCQVVIGKLVIPLLDELHDWKGPLDWERLPLSCQLLLFWFPTCR